MAPRGQGPVGSVPFLRSCLRAAQGLDQALLTYVDTLDGLRGMAARLRVKALQGQRPFANPCLRAVQGLDQAPLTYVDTLDGLRDMAARLGDVRELAVDLENHSYRSFQARTAGLLWGSAATASAQCLTAAERSKGNFRGTCCSKKPVGYLWLVRKSFIVCCCASARV